MSKNWETFSEAGSIAKKIRQNAKAIEAFRIPTNYYLWVIGAFGEDTLRLKLASYGEAPKTEEFSDMGFLIHLDQVDLKGVKASALKLAARAIFPFRLSAKADDDEEDWEYEE